MQKFFIETNQINDKEIFILGEDVNHIANVLRMQKNEKIQVCNKDNAKNYIVEIIQFEKERIITNIVEELNDTVEPNVKIDLYQGLPKSDKMEFIIQKTIEVGINKIIPVDMTRCVVKLNEKEAVKKIERWQKIAESAAKQSKRDIIPKIENIVKLEKINIEQYDKFFIAYEDESKNLLKTELNKIDKSENYKIGILVGPEGGLDIKEVEELKQKGAISISLGKRILRTETAPIVLTGNILYELEQ